MSDSNKTHSQSWFNELKQNNPMQAARTRKVLEMAGSCDVCSICGSQPAVAYRIDGETTKSHADPVLRLCSDCASTQMGLTGKHLTPLQ